MTYILLILTLSLEATIGLPLFFVYGAQELIARRFSLVVWWVWLAVALALASFYALSWPVVALFLIILDLAQRKLAGRLGWQVALFILWQLAFFIIAGLKWNYFALLHWPLFAFYIYKKKLRNYAT